MGDPSFLTSILASGGFDPKFMTIVLASFVGVSLFVVGCALCARCRHETADQGLCGGAGGETWPPSTTAAHRGGPAVLGVCVRAPAAPTPRHALLAPSAPIRASKREA